MKNKCEFYDADAVIITCNQSQFQYTKLNMVNKKLSQLLASPQIDPARTRYEYSFNYTSL